MYYRQVEHLASLLHERDTFVSLYFLLTNRFDILELRRCIYRRCRALLLRIGVVVTEIKRELSVLRYL